SYAAAERRKFRPDLLEQFLADSHVPLDCVRVVELVGIVSVRLLAQLLCLIDHRAEQFRGKLSVFRRNDLEVRPEEPHRLQLFPGKTVGRHRYEWVALNRAHKSQRASSAS